MDSISHFLFINDILIFGHTDILSLKAVQGAIDTFCDFSEMAIRREKSVILFSKSVVGRVDLEGVIGIPMTTFPIHYLDLPFGRLKHVDCGGMLTSLEKVLLRWQLGKLTYASIMQMLSWVFNGRVNFWLQAT